MISRCILLSAVSLTAVVGLSACGADSTGSGSGSTGAGSSAATSASSATDAAAAVSYPITITHALGTTTITQKPERVATVAWSNHEVPLALGVVPVGMSKATWGDDDNDGVLPWVEEKLTELQAQTPVLFDETDGINFEAVANTEPDVILASYSGITQEEYDKLSAIAPTVAYPEVAWGTSMTEMIQLNSTAMGMQAEGEQLAKELDEQVSTAFAAHPELAGKKVMFSYLDPKDLSQVGFYTTLDPRAGFLQKAGMAVPDAVAQASAGSKEFYQTISAENVDTLSDVDILVTYGDAEGALVKAVQNDARLATIPAVKEGRIATLVDQTPLAAAANPSPLSVGWGLDDYVTVLADATQ